MRELGKKQPSVVEKRRFRTCSAKRSRPRIEQLLHLVDAVAASCDLITRCHQALQIDKGRDSFLTGKGFNRTGSPAPQRTLPRLIMHPNKIINFVKHPGSLIIRAGPFDAAPSNQVPSPSVGRRIAHGAWQPIAIMGDAAQGQERIDCKRPQAMQDIHRHTQTNTLSCRVSN